MFQSLYPWLRMLIAVIPLVGLAGLVVIVLIAIFHHRLFRLSCRIGRSRNMNGPTPSA